MKMARRIFALTMALVMVLGLATAAFAAEHHHTISIENEQSGYVYVAYQIFDGDLDATGVLSNVEWGKSIAAADQDDLIVALNAIPAFATCSTAAEVAAVLATNSAIDHPTTMAFADVVAQYVTNGTTSTRVDANLNYIIEDLEDGYYLVVNTVVPDAVDTTYSRYILEVVRDTTVAHKGTYPTVDKKILEGTERVNVSNAAIGDIVRYEIVGTLPSNIADYDTYYYVFTDTLSKGLTYNNDMVITVNGTDVTDYFYTGATAWDSVDGTTITVGIQDLIALSLLDLDAATDGNQPGAITKNSTITLTYSSTLNQYAEVGTANPNEVYLEYSNNPNDDGDGTPTPPSIDPPTPVPVNPTGKTPEAVVETFTTGLVIKKIDGAGQILTGAEFELTGTKVNQVLVHTEVYTAVAAGTGDWYKLNDGTYTQDAPVYDDPATDGVNEDTSHAYASLTADYILETVSELKTATESVTVKAFVGDDGLVRFVGLSAGEYVLTETTTPAGFNTIEPIEFEIQFNATEKKFHCDDNSAVVYDALIHMFATQVVNTAGSTLPSTGGIGTTLFYLLGGFMVLGATVLLITKKRMAC